MNQSRITIPIPQPDEILSPKLDLCFKMIFGSEQNKMILSDLLQSILSESHEDIGELTLMNPMTDKEYRGDKQGIFDIKARLKSGITIDIEIQVLNTREMAERILFYISKSHCQQVGAGESYREMKKTISIVVTDFNMIAGCEEYYNRFWFVNPKNGIRLSDKMEIHILELPKLPEQSDGSKRYKWMKFLTSGKEGMEMLSRDEGAIKLAYEELQRISLDDEKRWAYESRLKSLLDEEFRIGSAIREGMEKGRTEGLVEGMEKGKRETAFNLLNMGLAIEEIAKATGLEISEIKIMQDNG